MKKISIQLIIACLFIFIGTNANAQLVANNSLTPTQLVQQVLLGAGINAFNITYSGDTGAIGSFNGVNSNIGLSGGVIMSTGDIFSCTGPSGCSVSTPWNYPGDSMLSAITGGVTNDAAILEFDFVPIGDTVKFTYVFASDEYPSFVNSFNDVFAFFIRGPGIAGYPNIAVLPNAFNTPVCIDSVNDGQSDCPTAPTGPCQNCAYYIDNTSGTTVSYA